MLTKVLDCSTCGGPMPAERRCCPHCHCKSAAWKRWAVIASTAIGLGAGCDSSGLPPSSDMHVDLSHVDEAQPESFPDYGPARPLDLAEPPDGG